MPFRFLRLCGRRYLQQSQTTGSVALAPTMGSSKTLTNISSFDASFAQCSFHILCNLSTSGASSGGLGLAVFLNPLQLAANRKEDVQCLRLLLCVSPPGSFGPVHVPSDSSPQSQSSSAISRLRTPALVVPSPKVSGQRWSDCVAVSPRARPARSQRQNGTGTGIQEPLVCGRHFQLTAQEETKNCLFFVPTRNPRNNTLSRVLQDLKVLPRFFTPPSIGSTNWEQAVRCPRDGAHSSMLGLALSLRHWWSTTLRRAPSSKFRN